MPCRPSDNNLNPPIGPGLPIPGFGIPFSPYQLPIPGFKFPENFPESILDLLNQIFAIFPSGTFLPQIDNFANDILKAIASIFNQIAPYLSIYNFFTALLNMILCIIDVLCALPNPAKTVKAVKKLIKTCLPPFLNLFPWLALLAMIMALLLLLIALIEYIINRFLAIIEDLLANLNLLGDAATLTDTEASAAVAIKIASLLCILDNLFAIFSAIGAIFAIIEVLSKMSGRRVCAGDSGCCDTDICPEWISNNPDGIPGQSGTLIYNSKYTTVDSLRNEKWQFIDDQQVPTYPFKSIITSLGEGIWWPESTSFTNETLPSSAPYTLNLIFKNFDPISYNPLDSNGVRDFEINDIIVSTKPIIGTINYQDNLSSSRNINGTLNLCGGKVYEVSYSGTEKVLIPYIINGSQATIETFIHKPDEILLTPPTSDDSIEISNIEFTLVINHISLLSYNLITYGCMPELRYEADALNVVFSDIRSIETKFGGSPIPNIAGTQTCLTNAMAELRKDVSIDNVEKNKLKILDCLLSLKQDSTEKFNTAFNLSVSNFDSSVSIEPDLQFITRFIDVNVILKDSNGTNICKSIPFEIQDNIANELSGIVSLGTITSFTYDQSLSLFKAQITSSLPGEGQLKISFQNNIFKVINNKDNVDEQTTFDDLILNYTFIGTTAIATGTPNAAIDRDASDISNS
jgi:hypothetical protein